MPTRRRLLTLVLRLFAGVDLLALLAVIMPASWMAETHAVLGMGELPREPVVGYLARSVAWLYAVHGAALLVVSFDVTRYATLVTFFGVAAIAHGAVLLAIDVVEGMPWWWAALEGPIVATTGIIVLLLQAGDQPGEAGAS